MNTSKCVTFGINSTLNEEDFLLDQWTVKQPYKTIQDVAIFIFGGFAIFGNVFIILLAVNYTKRKSMHRMIINMALSDTLVVLMSWGLQIPLLFNRQIWAEIKGQTLGDLCKILNFVMQVGMWTTFFSLFVITVERFRVTRKTLERAQPWSVKRGCAVQTICWVSAIAIAIPDLFKYRIKEENCVFKCTKQSQFPILSIAIHVFTTCMDISILVLSIVILRNLSNLPAIQDSLPEKQRKTRAKKTASAMKMVLSSLLLYFCCYFPYDFADFLQTRHYNLGTILMESIWFEFAFVILPLVNSCFSPVIYVIFLADFRKAAKNMLVRGEAP